MTSSSNLGFDRFTLISGKYYLSGNIASCRILIGRLLTSRMRLCQKSRVTHCFGGGNNNGAG